MYVWDEEKRRRNIAKHGVDFARMADFDWDSAGFVETQIVDNEQRDVILGRIGEKVFVVICTDDGDAVRIISLRPANKREMAQWLRR